jgi:hypothetical protein
MATILENLSKIHVAVVVDKETKQGELGAALSRLAVKAIMGGLGSPDWVKYMSIFADNAEQLQLLTQAAEDEEENENTSYLPQTRAYIVSNSVCAPQTESFTAMGVNLRIADAAPAGVDGTVARPGELDGLFPV